MGAIEKIEKLDPQLEISPFTKPEVLVHRQIHIGYADSYIYRQHQAHESNPTSVGTGGTPFMTYLQKHLDETKQAIAA